MKNLAHKDVSGGSTNQDDGGGKTIAFSLYTNDIHTLFMKQFTSLSDSSALKMYIATIIVLNKQVYSSWHSIGYCFTHMYRSYHFVF